MFTYDIDDTLTVRIYVDGGEHPAILQEANPSGEAWKSKATATKWAEAYIVAAETQIAEAALAARLAEEAEALSAEVTDAPNDPAE